MINIILISHDYRTVEAIKNYFLNMLPIDSKKVKLFSSGGLDEKTLGTNPKEIEEIIKNNPADLNLLVPDLGSSIFTSKSLKVKLKKFKIEVAKGSLIENGFAAYVAANSSLEMESIIKAANEIFLK